MSDQNSSNGELCRTSVATYMMLDMHLNSQFICCNQELTNLRITADLLQINFIYYVAFMIYAVYFGLCLCVCFDEPLMNPLFLNDLYPLV